jgi:hypothetical protein
MIGMKQWGGETSDQIGTVINTDSYISQYSLRDSNQEKSGTPRRDSKPDVGAVVLAMSAQQV